MQINQLTSYNNFNYNNFLWTKFLVNVWIVKVSNVLNNM